MGQEVPDRLERVGFVDRDTGELLELPGDHDHRHAGEVTDEHRLRQHVGQEAEPGDEGDQCDRTDHEAETGAERGVVRRIAVGEWRKCGRGHQCCGRLRADRQLARRTEQGVDRHRPDDCPQAGDGGQTGELGVRHDLRDEVGGNRDAGDDVAAQPDALVVDQLIDPGANRKRTGRS